LLGPGMNQVWNFIEHLKPPFISRYEIGMRIDLQMYTNSNIQISFN